MDKYQGYKHFMTSYEVDEENKNIVMQYADKTESTTIYSSHNMSVLDGGFSLNHAHLYTDHDLKTLKKVKMQETLQVSSNE